MVLADVVDKGVKHLFCDIVHTIVVVTVLGEITLKLKTYTRCSKNCNIPLAPISSSESLVILGNMFNTKESENRQHLDVGNQFGKLLLAAYTVKGTNESLKEGGHISFKSYRINRIN